MSPPERSDQQDLARLVAEPNSTTFVALPGPRGRAQPAAPPAPTAPTLPPPPLIRPSPPPPAPPPPLRGPTPPAWEPEPEGAPRVFALLCGVALLVCAALLLALWSVDRATSIAPLPSPQPVPTTGAAPPEDSGLEAPIPPSPPPVQVHRSAHQQGREDPGPATPTPSGPAPLGLRLDSPGAVRAVELRCPSWGPRAERATLDSQGRARFSAVPQDHCQLYFKGSPAQFGPVHGGQELRCFISMSTAVCR